MSDCRGNCPSDRPNERRSDGYNSQFTNPVEYYQAPQNCPAGRPCGSHVYTSDMQVCPSQITIPSAFPCDARFERHMQSPAPAKSIKALPEGAYSESNPLAALQGAAKDNKPVVSFVVGEAGLDAKTAEAMKALKNDVTFVAIDRKYSDWLTREKAQGGNGGLENSHFWALANLSGANGDLNRIKPNTVGLYDAKSFDPRQPENGLRTKASASYDKQFDLVKFLKDNKVVSEDKLAALNSGKPAEAKTVVSEQKTAVPEVTKSPEHKNPPEDQLKKPVEKSASLKPFNETNVLEAVAEGKVKGLPLISFAKGDKADPNVSTALDYMRKQGMVTPVEINDAKAQQMKLSWMDANKFHALESMVKSRDADPSQSLLKSFNANAVGENADKHVTSPAWRTQNASSPEAIMTFLKESKVKFTPETEAAVNALLRGQPLPEVKPVESKPVVKPSDESRSIEDAKPIEELKPVEELKPKGIVEPKEKTGQADAQPQDNSGDALPNTKVKTPTKQDVPLEVGNKPLPVDETIPSLPKLELNLKKANGKELQPDVSSDGVPSQPTRTPPKARSVNGNPTEIQLPEQSGTGEKAGATEVKPQSKLPVKDKNDALPEIPPPPPLPNTEVDPFADPNPKAERKEAQTAPPVIENKSPELRSRSVNSESETNKTGLPTVDKVLKGVLSKKTEEVDPFADEPKSKTQPKNGKGVGVEETQPADPALGNVKPFIPWMQPRSESQGMLNLLRGGDSIKLAREKPISAKTVDPLDVGGLRELPLLGRKATAGKVDLAQPDRVKTAAELQAKINEAREKKLPLIVTKPTPVCTDGPDGACFEAKLSATKIEALKDRAVVVEIPLFGIKDIEPGKTPEAEAIAKYLPPHDIKSKEHKTKLDLEVFTFEAGKMNRVEADAAGKPAKGVKLKGGAEDENTPADAANPEPAAEEKAPIKTTPEKGKEGKNEAGKDPSLEEQAPSKPPEKTPQQIADENLKLEEARVQEALQKIETAKALQREATLAKEQAAKAALERERNGLVPKIGAGAEGTPAEKKAAVANAQALAQKHNVPIVLHVGRDNCNGCNAMKGIYASNDFTSKVKGHAVGMEVNVWDQASLDAFPKNVRDKISTFSTVPHTLILNPKDMSVMKDIVYPQPNISDDVVNAVTAADRQLNPNRIATAGKDTAQPNNQQRDVAPAIKLPKGVGDVDSALDIVMHAEKERKPVIVYAADSSEMGTNTVKAFAALKEMKKDAVNVIVLDRQKARQVLNGTTPERYSVMLKASGGYYTRPNSWNMPSTPHAAVYPNAGALKDSSQPNTNPSLPLAKADDFLSLVDRGGVKLTDDEKAALIKVFEGK